MLKEVFGEAAPGDPAKWLNHVDVVDAIVRHFFAFVLREVDTPDQFADRVDFECRRMNGLFLGSGPDYGFERGSWNTPGNLGASLLTSLYIDGEERNAVRDAFMIYANKLIDLAVASGGHTDARWQRHLDELVAVLRSALLGTPVPRKV